MTTSSLLDVVYRSIVAFQVKGEAKVLNYDSVIVRLIVASTVTYGVLYIFNYYLLSSFWAHFRNHKKVGKVEWLTRINSNINAFFSVIVPVAILVKEDDIWTSLRSQSTAASITLAIFVGYIIIDLIAIISVVKEMKNAGPMLVHHTMALVGPLLAIHHNNYLLVLTLYMITEASTPFVNTNWMINDLGLRGSIINPINGVVGILTFFTVRICGQFYVMHLVYKLRYDFLAVEPYMVAVFFLQFSAIIYLNTTWFIGMVKIASKMFSSNSKK